MISLRSVARGPVLLLIVVQRLWSFRVQTLQRLSILGFEELPCSVILLHVQKPPGFRYHPGFCVSINIPSVSALEWHPFTIASAPHHKHLSFVIGTKGDWTSLLARQLEGQQQGTRSALLLEEADAFEQGGSACPDGMPAPLLAHLRYACATRCRHMLDHESLLLIAGGTGISAFLSILASLTCPVYRASKVSKLRSLTLVWSVQDAQLASLVTEPLQLLQEQQLQSQQEGSSQTEAATSEYGSQAESSSQGHLPDRGRQVAAELSVEFHRGRPDYAQYTALVCELGAPADATNNTVKLPTGRLPTVGVCVCGPTGMRLSCQEAFMGLDEGLRRHAKWYDQEFKR
ncbi:MAG: hypothetical protein WDW38_001337 [Sanguina aurantia]